MCSCSSRRKSKTGQPQPSVSRCRSAGRWMATRSRSRVRSRSRSVLATASRSRIAGRIDRINEVGAATFEVLDYKTGGYWRDSWKGVFAGGRRLQHALYGLAALELLKTRHKKPKVRGGVYYFSSHKGRGERVRIEAPALASVGAVLADLREVITSGHFTRTSGRGRLQVLRLCRRVWRQSECPGGDQAGGREGRRVQEAREPCLIRESRTSSRAAPSARSCSPTSWSRRAPAPARRRCWPSAWPPVWPKASTRSSTWRPSPSRARRRPSCAAVSTWRSKPGWCPRARPRRRKTEIRRLQSALSNLERFFAGTIHSFCARLLRERPVESGVSPGFTELDEVQDLELRQRVWREFITSARAAGDPDVAALLEADIKLKDLDPAFATVCDNDDVEFPPGDGACPDPKPAAKALDKFWKAFQKHMPSSIDEDAKCEMLLAAQRFAGQWRVSQKRLQRPAVVAALLAPWDRESKITMKWWSDDQAEGQKIRAAIVALHEDFHADVVEPYLAAWRQYVYRLSIRLLTRARRAASDERRRLNSLNYGDLLNLTARVLRENVGVRRALQQKYRYLLVDEFQDTDPVQAEIVFWLAEATDVASTSSKTNPADWRQVPLRPGALFVVGDPKQSIYRFRRADIDIYNIVRGRFSAKGVGVVLPLTMNFRSGPDLCTWANTVFETCFPKEPTVHAPRFAPLDPKPKQAVRGEVCTLTHHCDKAAELPSVDAARIAAYIRSEVDAGRRRFSDFLILTRKKTNRIAPYAAALEALNIPAEVSGAGAFGESREVEALTKLLRALADPQDPLALVAVLRGPLFGISDPELFAFKQSGGWFSIFQPDDMPDGGPQPPDRVRMALDALNHYYRWTRVLPDGRRARTDPRSQRIPRAGGDDARWCGRGRRAARRRPRAPGRRNRRQPRRCGGCARSRPRGDERSGVAPARAWACGRRAADEPAQGQGARGERRVSGRPGSEE